LQHNNYRRELSYFLYIRLKEEGHSPQISAISKQWSIVKLFPAIALNRSALRMCSIALVRKSDTIKGGNSVNKTDKRAKKVSVLA
jgi:hypothetical protein